MGVTTMSKLVALLSHVPGAIFSEGVSEEEIIHAEEELGLRFPDDYRQYLKEFGTVSFYHPHRTHMMFDAEWTGVNTEQKYRDVVITTLEERKRYPDFPHNAFVIENMGVPGMSVICDTEGNVSLMMMGVARWTVDICKYAQTCQERGQRFESFMRESEECQSKLAEVITSEHIC